MLNFSISLSHAPNADLGATIKAFSILPPLASSSILVIATRVLPVPNLVP